MRSQTNKVPLPTQKGIVIKLIKGTLINSKQIAANPALAGKVFQTRATFFLNFSLLLSNAASKKSKQIRFPVTVKPPTVEIIAPITGRKLKKKINIPQANISTIFFSSNKIERKIYRIIHTSIISTLLVLIFSIFSDKLPYQGAANKTPN